MIEARFIIPGIYSHIVEHIASKASIILQALIIVQTIIQQVYLYDKR